MVRFSFGGMPTRPDANYTAIFGQFCMSVAVSSTTQPWRAVPLTPKGWVVARSGIQKCFINLEGWGA